MDLPITLFIPKITNLKNLMSIGANNELKQIYLISWCKHLDLYLRRKKINIRNRHFFMYVLHSFLYRYNKKKTFLYIFGNNHHYVLYIHSYNTNKFRFSRFNVFLMEIIFSVIIEKNPLKKSLHQFFFFNRQKWTWVLFLLK